VKPVGTVQYGVEKFSIDGAVEPTTGESFFLELPYLIATKLQIILHAFSPNYRETRNIVLRDNGRWHTAKSLVMPDHVVCLLLPPYSPQAQSHRTAMARGDSSVGVSARGSD
jgi:hypothetical protein